MKPMFFAPVIRERRSLRGLSQSVIPASPFPNGISVAGTGAGGSATIWRVGYYPALDLWVADTGFGIAPLYTAAQYRSIVAVLNGMFRLAGHPETSFGGSSAPGVTPSPYAVVAQGFGIAAAYAPPVSLLTRAYASYAFTEPGSVFSITTSDGGSQSIVYGQSGGYFVPVSARGMGSPGASLFDRLIQVGAIVGAAVVIGATLASEAGVLPSSVTVSAGPGAGAVGGSGFTDTAISSAVASGAVPAAAVAPATDVAPAAAAGGGSGAGGAGVTVGQAVGYVSTATSAAATVMKIIGGGAGGGPVAVSGPGGLVAPPGSTIAVPPGYLPPAGLPPPSGALVAPDGTASSQIMQALSNLPPWALLAGGALVLIALMK